MEQQSLVAEEWTNEARLLVLAVGSLALFQLAI